LLRRISAGERHSVRQRRLVLITTGGAGCVRWSYLLHVQDNSKMSSDLDETVKIDSFCEEGEATKLLSFCEKWEAIKLRAPNGPPSCSVFAVVTTATRLWLTVKRLRPSHESCTTVARSRGSRATVSRQSRPLH